MGRAGQIEKFSTQELGALRMVIMQDEVDASEVSGMLSAFLNGRGYGVDLQLLHDAVLCMEGSQCEPRCMQEQLERVALVM